MKIWVLISFFLINEAYSCFYKVCVCNGNTVHDQCKTCSPFKQIAKACNIEPCKLEFKKNEITKKNEFICTLQEDITFDFKSKMLCTSLYTMRGCFISIEKKLKNVNCFNQKFTYVLKCKKSPEGIICQIDDQVREFYPEQADFMVEDSVSDEEYFWNADIQKNFMNYQASEKKDPSLDELKVLLEYADYAYERKMVNNPIMLNIKTVKNSEYNLLAVTGYSQVLQKIMVVFRGTVVSDESGEVDLSNIKVDIDSSQVESDLCKDCKLHNGFLTAYKSIHNDLKKNIQEIQKAFPFSIIFTGHSLGGALATIAAANYKDENSKIVASLFTFGSPRVGNKEFADFLNEAITHQNYRVTYLSDPVVCVPNNIQYTHVGKEIKFTNKDNFIMGHYNDSSGCLPSILSISDHSRYWDVYKSTKEKDVSSKRKHKRHRKALLINSNLKKLNSFYVY